MGTIPSILHRSDTCAEVQLPAYAGDPARPPSHRKNRERNRDQSGRCTPGLQRLRQRCRQEVCFGPARDSSQGRLSGFGGSHLCLRGGRRASCKSGRRLALPTGQCRFSYHLSSAPPMQTTSGRLSPLRSATAQEFAGMALSKMLFDQVFLGSALQMETVPPAPRNPTIISSRESPSRSAVTIVCPPTSELSI